MNRSKGFCGFCGKRLDTYDRKIQACERCGTSFDEIEPVSKAGAAEATPNYEDGLYE